MPGVYVSRVIHAPIDQVWERARDFDSVLDWLPPIVGGGLEADHAPTEVGAVRRLELEDGQSFREKLLEHSDIDYYRRYTVVEGPLPVENYLGKLQFHSITDENYTFGEWSNSFDVADDASDEEPEATEAMLEEFFDLGLQNLGQVVTG